MYGKGVFGWLKVTFTKQCKEEEKAEENGAIFRNAYLIKNTPGVKKGRPRTKQALLKKM